MKKPMVHAQAPMLIYQNPYKLLISYQIDSKSKKTQVCFTFLVKGESYEPITRNEIFCSGPLDNAIVAKKLIKKILLESYTEGNALLKSNGCLSTMMNALDSSRSMTLALIDDIMSKLANSDIVMTQEFETRLKAKYRQN